MSRSPYPEGLDCVWLASDREGHLGAFITAGVGPIPTAALEAPTILIEDIEGRLLDLPKRSQVRLLASVERPDSYLDLAQRGLFVYDWTDIHRSKRHATQAYELVAAPFHPRLASSLPLDLQVLATTAQLPDVAFTGEDSLNMPAHLTCVLAD